MPTLSMSAFGGKADILDASAVLVDLDFSGVPAFAGNEQYRFGRREFTEQSQKC
jgi:hypothetical protein